LGATIAGIAKTEGIASFWKGLTFAYGRELSYTSIKLGAYAPVRDALGAGKESPFYLKFLAGAITGGVGSVVGNPFDVMKTLAQTNKEASLPLTKLVGNMYASQGIGGFYRGVQVNIARACVLNATKMGCYDMAKGYVTQYTGWSRTDPRTAFSSSFIAGFFMTVVRADLARRLRFDGSAWQARLDSTYPSPYSLFLLYPHCRALLSSLYSTTDGLSLGYAAYQVDEPTDGCQDLQWL
jgi:hypothetical protein